MGKQIPPERLDAYYGGMAMLALGVIMFFGAVISGVTQPTEPSFAQHDESGRVAVFVIGMILAFIGAICMNIGGKGLAGSGVILGPEKAREDLEPYSRMAGGMVKDALEEADVNLSHKAEKVIMVKCQHCGKLNEENAKFCNECGKEI
jgi:hypothetical protein